ncbi:hypothetical protein IQ268_16065 [Oculatella sp. LEGE 06141]|uniref:hypothetical protein n=1 Tax=Oculatella sp. LEGE 06141 TaxID=1828648 RepID=UPI0018802548|nr:hypothetical protein [Oculatella sp. LEGE 06141]MBE9180087.1 hypothetical protein [Oculatella sp. LEGE 06141]
MKIKDTVWQGNFGYWQNLFIHQNILLIGYTAWDGYLSFGRGLVVCNVTTPISPSVDWRTDRILFNRSFVPQAETTANVSVLKMEQDAIAACRVAIATYNPSEAIVVLVSGNNEVDINLLHHLTISPTECYNQVRQRWDEFQPSGL